ncbi:Ebp2-domain-containing protein, partial [Microstroma glucosiphilum]
EEDEDEDDEMDEDFEDEDSEDEGMDEDEDDDDDDDASISDASDASAEGTSERGLKRLIEALGEDGLDEDELAELAALQDGEDKQGAAADDDLKRELVFYKQALSAAQLGRQKVLAAGMPFSRPDDFFAEMVKSDSHMERVRQTLLDERAGIKASEEAKRQRELKKFGKKVQVQKGLERQKNKKEMEEKIEGLKRSE